MPSLDYQISSDIGGAAVNVESLLAEIEAAGPYSVNVCGISATGDVVSVHLDEEPSNDDTTAINGVIVAHDHDLEQAKLAKVKAIDARTDELIGSGFTYADKQFSLSIPSQSKMTAAHHLKDHQAFVYPVNWNTIDDEDVYSIPDAADMGLFYLTAIGTIRAYLDSGTGLKDAVRAAADVAAVEAVVDPR